MSMSWRGKTVLITGGTGSFGQTFTKFLLKKSQPPVIRIFSRDEFKQNQMQQELNDKRLRFLLGDVRDEDRLKRAMEEVDVVVHAAALKQIPLGEYNPFEVVQTNILGTQNVIEAALDNQVKRVMLISSDKAVYPINLYGATKLCAEKLFVQGNVYSGKRGVIFSVVRYGNVLGSRGSVVPMWQAQKDTGVLQATDKHMTRFWITLDQACSFVGRCIKLMKGGEIFVPKLPSVKLVDLARAIAPGAKLKLTGVRMGEKLHETLITEEESRRLVEFKNHYLIKPQFPFWIEEKSEPGRPKKAFIYQSDLNKLWLSQKQLQRWLK